MAQLDFKKVTVYLEDGYNEIGAVNNALGYTTNTTTLKVDAITGVVPVSATLTLAGDDQIYSVVSTTETLGNTTQIVITPGILIAATDDQVITFGGRRLEIKVGEGNLTYSEKRTMEYKKDRGELDTVREGDQEPMDVRLDIQWDFLSAAGSDTVPTPEEVLKQIGEAEDWLTSSADPCEPYAVNIVAVYTPNCSSVDSELFRLKDYRWESLDHDFKAGTLSTSGKCNVTVAEKERRSLVA